MSVRHEFTRSIESHPILANLHVINPEAVKVIDFDRAFGSRKGYV